MTVAIETEVRRIVGQVRESKLLLAFDRAWTDWQQDQGRYNRWPRTRANMFFERLTVRLQEQFADDPGVRFVFHDETVKVIFDDSIMARCKKADGNGFGHNVETQANALFVECQPDLFGMPGLQKVELVYSLNDIETEIKSVVMQARDGEMRLWAYRVEGELPAAGTGSVTPLPSPPIPPSTDASELVKPRKKADEKDEAEDK